MYIVHKENDNEVLGFGNLPKEYYEENFPGMIIDEYPDNSIIFHDRLDEEGFHIGIIYTININKDDALEFQLNKIDELVSEKKNLPFEYDGNNFYPVTEDIHSTRTRYHGNPETNIIVWKTADKDLDGINNIYRQFTPTEFDDFSNAFYDYISGIWNTGETHKVTLKTIYNQGASTGQDILDYDITTNW